MWVLKGHSVVGEVASSDKGAGADWSGGHEESGCVTGRPWRLDRVTELTCDR